jgi:hypothetical protein
VALVLSTLFCETVFTQRNANWLALFLYVLPSTGGPFSIRWKHVSLDFPFKALSKKQVDEQIGMLKLLKDNPEEEKSICRNAQRTKNGCVSLRGEGVSYLRVDRASLASKRFEQFQSVLANCCAWNCLLPILLTARIPVGNFLRGLV